MAYEYILVEQPAEGVGLVRLNRPRTLNALSGPLMDELMGALAEMDRDPAYRCLIITGNERAFAAGADISEMAQATPAEMMALGFIDRWERLRAIRKPVIAAVSGFALGGGCELALASDVVLAREDAQFAQPEIRLGVFAPAAAALLPRLLGRQRALDLLLTGRKVGAEEARELGLAARVFPAPSFDAGVADYARALARLSRPVLVLCKRAVLENLERPLTEALAAADRLYLEELMALRDAHEGLAAFMEKREPVWSDA